MSLIKNLFDKVTGRNDAPSASLAKERLQLIIAHESNGKTPDFLPRLKDELMAVISRYTEVTEDTVNLNIERRGNTDYLEMNLVLGEPKANVQPAPAAALAARVIAEDRSSVPAAPAAPAAPVAPAAAAVPEVLQQVETKRPAPAQPPAPPRDKVRVESSHPARNHKGKRGRK